MTDTGARYIAEAFKFIARAIVVAALINKGASRAWETSQQFLQEPIS